MPEPMPLNPKGSAGLGVFPILVFLAACGCVLIFRAVLPSAASRMENSDFTGYYEPVARQILAGRGPRVANGNPAIAYPPGYSTVVALAFGAASTLGVSEDAALTAVSVVSFGLTAVLLFVLAAEMWPMPRALIAPAGFMTYPMALWLTKQPNSEIPFLPLFVASILFYWKSRTSDRNAPVFGFLAGIFAGAAMLIRPIAIGLGVLLAVLVVLERAREGRGRRLGVAALILAGNLVAVLPWEIFVFRNTGSVIALAKHTRGPLFDGFTFGLNYDTRGSTHKANKTYRSRIDLPPAVLRLQENLYEKREQARSAQDIIDIMWREAKAHPGAMAELCLLKLGRSWYGTDSLRYEKFTLLVQLVYLVLLGWAVLMACRAGAEQRQFVVVLLCLTFYFWCLTFIALSIVRYMIPAIILYFALLPGIARSKQRVISTR